MGKISRKRVTLIGVTVILLLCAVCVAVLLAGWGLLCLLETPDVWIRWAQCVNQDRNTFSTTAIVPKGEYIFSLSTDNENAAECLRKGGQFEFTLDVSVTGDTSQSYFSQELTIDKAAFDKATEQHVNNIETSEGWTGDFLPHPWEHLRTLPSEILQDTFLYLNPPRSIGDDEVIVTIDLTCEAKGIDSKYNWNLQIESWQDAI